jgi:hypothetical protein
LEEIAMPELEERLKEAGFKDTKDYVQKLVKFFGSQENLLRHLDKEQIVRGLVQELGAEQTVQMVQRLAQETQPTKVKPRRK